MFPAHLVIRGHVPFSVGKLHAQPFLRLGGANGQGRQLPAAADRVGRFGGKQQIAAFRADVKIQLFQIAAAGTALLQAAV